MKPMRTYNEWLLHMMIAYGVDKWLEDVERHERVFLANAHMLGHIVDEYDDLKTGLGGDQIVYPKITAKGKQYLEKQQKENDNVNYL